MQPTHRAGRPGFTLMEVLVAMSVLTIAIAGAAFMLTSAYGAYRHQDRTIETDRLVHDQLETLTGTPYSALRGNIQKARRPDTPPTAPPPAGQDWVSPASGEASAKWELEPPKEPGQDWIPVPVVENTSGIPLQVGAPQAAKLKADLRLQYWDPTFDAPAANDRGLIRATFRLHGGGIDKQAVKYLARDVRAAQ